MTNTAAALHDDTGYFMSQGHIFPLPVSEKIQIGTADAAGIDFDQQLIGAERGEFYFSDLDIKIFSCE
jgi:hypothetical protein